MIDDHQLIREAWAFLFRIKSGSSLMNIYFCNTPGLNSGIP